MMGIRHSTDSVRVRIVLTAMENTSRDLTGGVPLGAADARIHDPTRPGSPKRPPKRWVKVCVLERHGRNDNVGRGFVKGFGLERGALASSVGHDSHNLCVLGASDEDMALAVNRVIELGGGFVAVCDGQVTADLPLPIAGLMSGESAEMVRPAVATLRDAVHAMGCPLAGPLLQLSFLPLPVITHLKITDRGLVDVDRFELIDR